MARPLTRTQHSQNAVFLKALERTGNARLAAREMGLNRSTFTKRRAKHPDFAAQWEAALKASQAQLVIASGVKQSSPASVDDAALDRHGATAPRDDERKHRTTGGELVLTRLANGRVQLRRAQPGRITVAAETAFLTALAACANVRLSAAAAGFAHSSFYARRRRQRPFDREMRAALDQGYLRVELAAFAAALPESLGSSDWQHNDPPPIPPMTAAQALQLLHLHEKSVRQGWEQPHRRRRRGESEEAYIARLSAMWTAEKARQREDEIVRRALCEMDETGLSAEVAAAVEAPILPALDQVTGWSKASGKPPHNPELALFGGWRLEDLEKRKRRD